MLNTVLLITLTIYSNINAKYTPDWSSLDQRKLPEWYDDAKFGIFCHWGVYSVPAYGSEWIWWHWKGSNPQEDTVNYINKNYKQGTTYADFAKEFTAEHFNATEFLDIVESSAARYFVFTSKHHEGFTMWPNKNSWNWNSVDVGPKRDIVGELANVFKKSSIHFGLYFSQYEWFNPLYIDDGELNTTFYTDMVSYPQMFELITKYEPDVLWSDGDWDRTPEYWKSKEFLSWLYNDSPVKEKIVVNDRWGFETMGKHGGFLTFADNFDPGQLIKRKWENCMSLDKSSWGFRRNIKSADIHSTHEIISQIARTVSCNGNFLLNVPPDQHGKIPIIFESKLRRIGSFIAQHDEALFGTKPWIYQNDTTSLNVWYTSRYRSGSARSTQTVFNAQLQSETIIYAWILNTNFNKLILDAVIVTNETIVSIMGTNQKFTQWVTGSPLVINDSDINWKNVPRRDVIILKIEFAATNIRNPLMKSSDLENNLV